MCPTCHSTCQSSPSRLIYLMAMATPLTGLPLGTPFEALWRPTSTCRSSVGLRTGPLLSGGTPSGGLRPVLARCSAIGGVPATSRQKTVLQVYPYSAYVHVCHTCHLMQITAERLCNMCWQPSGKSTAFDVAATATACISLQLHSMKPPCISGSLWNTFVIICSRCYNGPACLQVLFHEQLQGWVLSSLTSLSSQKNSLTKRQNNQRWNLSMASPWNMSFR